MIAKPCPFCNSEMKPTFDHKNMVNGYAHPTVSDPWCFFSGHHIGSKLLPIWNKRTEAAVFMDIVDGHPVFNQHGQGQPTDTKMMNDTIAYYRKVANQ